VACENAETLRIALLGEQGDVLSESSVVDGDGFLGVNTGRAFDSSVQWFVYGAADRQLHAVDLGASDWKAVPGVGYHSNGMRLSPIEAAGEFLMHSSTELYRISLERESYELLSDSLDTPFQCGADFGDTGPNGWCGGNLVPSRYSVDPSGASVVYPDGETETLRVVDLRVVGGEPHAVSEVTVNCDEGNCASAIRFAP
jgi:hypothetical protein